MMPANERRRNIRTLLMVRRIMFLALLPALAWWAISGGDTASWWFGIPVVIISALASKALSSARRGRLRLKGLVPFVAFFLFESMRGGVDVARRALHPRLPIAPAFVRFGLRLPQGPARVFLVNTISLLPGTLSVQLEDGWVLIHVLDDRMPFDTKLRILEVRVAAVFGAELTNGNAGRRMVHE